MSLSPAGLVRFPDQQKIIDYINTHPRKELIDRLAAQNIFPSAIQKIAVQFANKTMKSEEIESNIKAAITNAEKEWSDLTNALNNLIMTPKDQEQGSEPSAFTQDRQCIYTIIESEDTLKTRWKTVFFKVFTTILDDLLENATYTPLPGDSNAPESSGLWTRHVQKLT